MLNRLFGLTRCALVASMLVAAAAAQASAVFGLDGLTLGTSRGVGGPVFGVDALGNNCATACAVPGIVLASRASFLSGLSSSTTEEFNVGGFSAAAIFGGNGAISGGSLSNNVAAGGWNTTDPSQGSDGGWWQNAAATPIVITNSLSRINAIGFYLTDYGDADELVDLLIDGVLVSRVGPLDANGQVITPGTASGQVLFFGYYSATAFTSASLAPVRSPGPDPTQMPEPTTAMLVAASLIALGWVKRRRQQAG
ncbi:hypothetical protein BH11PSE10_BH11PSE10_11240 [soil metagenome]